MNDDELRQRFAELRDEERQMVRPFAVGPGPRRLVRWLVPVFGLILLIVTGLSLRDRGDFSSADRAAAQEISEWRAPTDGLLATPGHDLIATMPEIPELPKGVAP